MSVVTSRGTVNKYRNKKKKKKRKEKKFTSSPLLTKICAVRCVPSPSGREREAALNSLSLFERNQNQPTNIFLTIKQTKIVEKTRGGTKRCRLFTTTPRLVIY